MKDMDIKLQDMADQNIVITEELLKNKDENKRLREDKITLHKDMDNLLKEETKIENEYEF